MNSPASTVRFRSVALDQISMYHSAKGSCESEGRKRGRSAACRPADQQSLVAVQVSADSSRVGDDSEAGRIGERDEVMSVCVCSRQTCLLKRQHLFLRHHYLPPPSTTGMAKQLHVLVA